MLTILQLIRILVIGCLGAHFIVGRLQRRFLFSSGVEYISLGLPAGPQVTGVMTAEVVSRLTPVMSLAIGAIGLLYGLHLRGWNPTRIEGEFHRITLVEVLTGFRRETRSPAGRAPKGRAERPRAMTRGETENGEMSPGGRRTEPNRAVRRPSRALPSNRSIRGLKPPAMLRTPLRGSRDPYRTSQDV